MFTGIIEEIGKISSIKGGNEIKELSIHAPKIAKDAEKGQSISVNGVCLTVKETFSSGFQVQMGTETLKTTSLNGIRTEDRVHLERGMTIGSRLDGHIVQGHVDGTSELINKIKRGDNLQLSVKYPENLGMFFIKKGSVALDGVSLTIHSLDRKSNLLIISLIPHTIKSTLFSEYNEGKILNIEVDLIGKYIYNFISGLINGNEKNKAKNELSMEFLAKQGYL